MEKKPRISISDLLENKKISGEEMRKITGGWSFSFAIWEVGSIPGDSDLDGDYSHYVKNYVTDETTYY
jgi:hypothetical protein